MLQHAREEYGAAREEVRQRRRLAPCRAGSVLGGGSGPVTRARAPRARVGPASFVASNRWSYAPILKRVRSPFAPKGQSHGRVNFRALSSVA
jgi:hypothetical protein